MALLTTITAVGNGTLLSSSLAAVNSSDTVAVPSDACWLHVKNGGGGAITVTISDPGSTPVGNAGTTSAVSVAAGAERLFRLTTKHNSPSTGVATITYSGTTSVTAGVFTV